MNGIEPAEAEALKNGEIQAYNVAAQGEYSTHGGRRDHPQRRGHEASRRNIYEEAPQSWLCTPETAEECEEWETFPPEILNDYYKLWGVN